MQFWCRSWTLTDIGEILTRSLTVAGLELQSPNAARPPLSLWHSRPHSCKPQLSGRSSVLSQDRWGTPTDFRVSPSAQGFASPVFTYSDYFCSLELCFFSKASLLGIPATCTMIRKCSPGKHLDQSWDSSCECPSFHWAQSHTTCCPNLKSMPHMSCPVSCLFMAWDIPCTSNFFIARGRD